MESFMKPIYYNGQKIVVYDDILQFIEFDMVKDMLNLPKDDYRREIQRDEQFAKLIERVKPQKKYYHQSVGDRLLYLSRVHKLKYDVVEEHKLRKQRALDIELEKARQLRDAGKNTTNETPANGKGSQMSQR